MTALKVWSKLRMLGRYSVLAGSFNKSKQNDFLVYNLKLWNFSWPVLQNRMWRKIEKWIKGPRIILIIN